MKKLVQRMVSIILVVMIVITILPVNALAAQNREYMFRIHTAGINNAGSDAGVRIGLYAYDIGRASQHDIYGGPLSNGGDRFEKGTVDDCIFWDSTTDPWMINKIYLGNDGKTTAAGWAVWNVNLYLPYVAGGSSVFHAGRIDYNNVWIDNSEEARDCASLTRRNINNLGNFSNFGGSEYINASTSGELKKTWNCQIEDQYCGNETYNPWTMADPPVITVSSSNDNITAYKLDEKGEDGQVSFTADYKTLYAQMDAAGIGQVTFNFTVTFPSRSTNNNVHTQSLTVYRRCFELGNESIALSPTYSPMKDNFFFNKEKTAVTITVEPTSIHLLAPTKEQKVELAKNLSCSPELYINKEDGEKLCDMTYTVSNEGVITFKGAIPQEISSAQYGVRLQLNNVETTYDNSIYNLNGGMSANMLFTTHKVDTISPKASMVDKDSKPLTVTNVLKQFQQFYMISSETLYHSKSDQHGGTANDENYFRYSLFKYNDLINDYSNVASQITNYDGTGNKAEILAPINTTVLIDTPINLKLAQKEEGKYKMRVYACDFANNGIGGANEYIDYFDIYLDNQAPRVEVKETVQNQAVDGTKRIDYEFDITDISVSSGIKGAWARTYYCFVPSGTAMPEPDMSKIESGELDSILNQWAFVEGGASASTAIFKVKQNETFEGTLYYFTVDSSGNSSRIEVKKVFERPIKISNYDTKDTLITNTSPSPISSYQISFKNEENIETEYRWIAKDLNSNFLQSYRLFEAGAEVGAKAQLTDDGNSVIMDGNYTLEYKVTEKRSGNYKVFTKDYSFDNSAPTTKISWVNSNVSALPSQQANIRITDMSGVKSGLYRIVNPDGSIIKGYSDTAFTLTAGGENLTEIKETLTFSLDKNGVYGLRISARDKNDYSVLSLPEDSGLFALRKQTSEITTYNHSLEHMVSGIGVTNKDYSLNVTVTEPMLNANSLQKAQVVKYCISTDGTNYGPWTVAEGNMAVGADNSVLTHSFMLNNPVALSEGDNTIYIKTVCMNAGDDTEPVSTLISVPKVLSIRLDSAAPTYDEIRYNNTLPTTEDVIGTLRTSDFGTGVTDLTCDDSNVKISGGKDGYYEFTITGDVETSATLTDLVGNKVLIPVKVTNIDKDAPVISGDVEEVFSGERKDAEITIKITEKALDAVKFALLSDGASELDESAYENFEKASAFETTKTADGLYETVYTIFARGMTGTFSLGVKATDVMGHEVETVLEDSFTIEDVAAAVTKVASSPEKTKSKTTVSINFNTKVAVQEVSNAVQTLALTEAVIENFDENIALSEYSLTYDVVRSNSDAFSIKVLDECGRVSTLVVDPTAEFYVGNKITQTLTKNGEPVQGEGLISFNKADTIRLTIDTHTDYGDIQSFFMGEDSVLNGFVLNEAESVKSATDKMAYTKLCFDADHNGETIKTVSFSSKTGEVVENEYIAVAIVDETAPEFSVEYDITQSTGSDVTAFVKARDIQTGITKLEEKQEDGTFKEVETKIQMALTFTENGVKAYRVTNGAGMATEFEVSVQNIDKNPIVEGVDYTVKYRCQNYFGEWVPIKDGNSYANVLAVIEPIAGSSKILRAVNNNGLSKLLTHEENTFTFILKDTANNTTQQVVGYSNYDNEAGTIDWVLSNTEKTNQNITVAITITDKQNEVVFAQVKSSQGIVYPWKGVAIAGEYYVELDASGTYTVTAYDEAGNVWTSDIVVTNIDKAVPKISGLVYTTPQGTITGRDVRVDIQGFSKENVKMTGMELGGGLTTADVLYTPGSRSIRFKKNGYVSVFFEDDCGNVGSDVISVSNIYSKPPQLKAVATLAKDLLSVSVKFEKEVDNSGMPLDPFRDLSELYVVYGGITYKASEAAFTLKNNADYSFLIFDAAGSSQQIKLQVSGIDDVAPNITQVSWTYDYLEQNGENTWESKTAQKTLVIGTDTSGKEAGYVIGEDHYHVTNGNVTVTVTTDKNTTSVGTTNKPAKDISIIYQENGLYIFNQQAANGASDSYGIDVEVIDKVAPIIELKNGPELIFIEGSKDPSYAYDKQKLLDYNAYDVKKGVKTDFTSKVAIDYGTFDPENMANNKFDRSNPYYIKYTVYDEAGNSTVVQRTIRLVGFYDTIALINGVMPDSTNTVTAVGPKMEIALKNFAGVSYARYEKGIYTMGQMKTMGKTLVERNSVYTITGATEGWYTIYIQTDKRDYFNISVYYKPNEK